MAKFCGTCGSSMDDNAQVCGNCGALLDATAAPEKGFKPDDPEQKEKIKKIATFGGIGVAAIAVIAIVISIIVANTGVNSAINKIEKAYKNDDADAIIELLSPSYIGYTDNEDNEDTNEIFAEFVENTLANDIGYFDSKIDDDYKISIEVRGKVKELSERQMEELLEDNLYEFIPYDKDGDKEEFDIQDLAEIKSIKKVKVEIHAKEGKKDKDVERTLYFAKDSGKWTLLPIELDTSEYNYDD